MMFPSVVEIVPFSGYFVLICWAVFVFYWGISFMLFPPKKTIERQNIFWRLFPAIAIFLFLITIRSDSHLADTFTKPLWQNDQFFIVFADVISLCAVILLIWARTILGRNWSGTPSFKQEHELITKGPYQYVRHPIYSGIILLLLGKFLYFNSTMSLLIFIFFLIFFYARSITEEKIMIKHFPDQYLAYSKRVKALIPFVF